MIPGRIYYVSCKSDMNGYSANAIGYCYKIIMYNNCETTKAHNNYLNLKKNDPINNLLLILATSFIVRIACIISSETFY